MNRLQTTAAALIVLALADPAARAIATCRPACAVAADDDRRQQLFVARRGRHGVVRAAAPGQCQQRRDHHRLVRQPASAPGERVKLTVAILDQDLRADALRVSAAKQVYQNGGWVEAPVSAATVQKLEDIILTRARDLRRATVGG